MKKILLSIFTAISISASAVGIEVTASDLQWTIGNKWYMKVTSGKTISDFTSTGTSATWDFTSYLSSSVHDTITVANPTIGGATLSISSNIINETNYTLDGADYLVSSFIYGNTTYAFDAGMSIGMAHSHGDTWNPSTTVGGFVPASVDGEVIAEGSITTSYGTFNAILIEETIDISGTNETFYYWETKEYGRIATLIGGSLSVMYQNNFNAITSANNVSANNSNIYPNPATDNFTVTLNGLQNVKVFDALGNLVINKAANNNASFVNVSNLNAGVYFVQATANGAIQTSRVVVK